LPRKIFCMTEANQTGDNLRPTHDFLDLVPTLNLRVRIKAAGI